MEQRAMPTVDFFGHSVSRLIMGSNPFNGGSHVGPELDAEMDSYYTIENIKKALRYGQTCGINTTQLSGNHMFWKIMRDMASEGDAPLWIANTAPYMSSFQGCLRQIMASRPIAIYHHGSEADQMVHNGRTEELRDRLKMMRDTGLPVGLGTHDPALVAYSRDHGWDVDFYMTAVYNIMKYNYRPSSSITGISNSGEAFEEDDVPVMLDLVRQVDRPCLVFKILGASRVCTTDERIEERFHMVFETIKPTDCVVVGMFQRDRDQIRMNADLVRKYGQIL